MHACSAHNVILSTLKLIINILLVFLVNQSSLLIESSIFQRRTGLLMYTVLGSNSAHMAVKGRGGDYGRLFPTLNVVTFSFNGVFFSLGDMTWNF